MALPPTKPDYSAVYISPRYFVRRSGACDKGSYIETYRPSEVYYDTNKRMRAVVYLHGFDLGASRTYEAHIEHLVRQGFYVFFPNFQHGFCEYPHGFLATMGELAKMTLQPFPISPEGWLHNALDSVSGAFAAADLGDKPVDVYLFGHSLGGLFAMSWPHYARTRIPHFPKPLQVVAADPIPDSESLIPPANRIVGRAIHAFKDLVDIKTTGAELHVPLAILHGNDDKIAPKEAWVEPFQKIASPQRKMYLSFSDDHGAPALHAHHNQATQDTSFLPDWMASLFLDGPGVEDDLDWRYIWYGLDQVLRQEARADQLRFDMGCWSDGQPVRPIETFLSGE